MAEFDTGFAWIAGRFGRVEPRRQARSFLLGLRSDVDARSCWQLAEQAGDASPHAMQRLLGEAVWDADAVRDDLRGYVIDALGDSAGVLILDDTGDLKKGAGIPADVEFATKLVLARRMLTRALKANVPAAWATADEAYGRDGQLRRDLQRHGVGYVLAVAKSHRVTARPADGPVRADRLAADLPARLEPGQRRGGVEQRPRLRLGLDQHHRTRRRDRRPPLASGPPPHQRR